MKSCNKKIFCRVKTITLKEFIELGIVSKIPKSTFGLAVFEYKDLDHHFIVVNK